MKRILVVLTCLGAASAASVSWQGISAAEGDWKHKVVASPSVSIGEKKYSTRFNILARSGDSFMTSALVDGTQRRWGQLTDKDGAAIYKADSSGKATAEVDISNDPDYASFLLKGDKIFQITQFESPRPGCAYVSELVQDSVGTLKMKWTEPIDFSSMGGVWIPCAGVTTSWASHLGSEEYEMDAKPFDDNANADKKLSDKAFDSGFVSETLVPFLRYFKVYTNPDALTPADARKAGFYPYRYGYIWEAPVDSKGKVAPVRHYTMGRRSNELAYCMPDEKTCYMTDDGTNTMLNKFVATRSRDMSDGELFCAKVEQTAPEAGGNAQDFKGTVTWISLGKATNDEISGTIEKTKFQDIFEYRAHVNGTCPDGFTSVAHSYGSECLKLKDGMEKLASRFETRRYSAMKGCTTEFRKMEGFTYSRSRNKAYLAMSEISNGMEDKHAKSDKGGPNHLKLKKNSCGCVMELSIGGGYNVESMSSLICGKPIADGADGQFCALEGLANPDNVAMIDEYGQLIIGEDTVGGHTNDVMWIYDFADMSLTRIFSTPYGSETTSPFWYPNVNGFSYMTSVVQHPYGESDQKRISDSNSTGYPGYLGYMGPLPQSGSAAHVGASLLIAVTSILAAFLLQ